MAQRFGRSIAQPFHDHGSRSGELSAAIYVREAPGNNFAGGWVGSRAGLDWRKISSTPCFDPGPSSPQSVSITSQLPGTPRCPESSRKLWYPNVTSALDCVNFVSLKLRPLLHTSNIPDIHLCYSLSRPQGHSAIGNIMSLITFNDTNWNRSRDLSICITAL